MNRFFPGGNNGEFNFDHDDDDDDEVEDQEIDAVINIESDMMSMLELDLVEMGQRKELLESAAKIAAQDFWWYFRTPETKLRRIKKVFRHLEQVVYDEQPEKK